MHPCSPLSSQLIPLHDGSQSEYPLLRPRGHARQNTRHRSIASLSRAATDFHSYMDISGLYDNWHDHIQSSSKVPRHDHRYTAVWARGTRRRIRPWYRFIYRFNHRPHLRIHQYIHGNHSKAEHRILGCSNMVVYLWGGGCGYSTSVLGWI